MMSLIREIVRFFDVAHFLQELEALDNVQRWGIYHDLGMFGKQSSQKHEKQFADLSAIILAKIIPYYPKIDAYAIKVCIDYHEKGEIKDQQGDPGDVDWKTKEETDDAREVNELKVFLRIADRSLQDSEMIEYLLSHYLLQYADDDKKIEKLMQHPRVVACENKYHTFRDKKFEAKVFNAIEYYNYLVDQIRQFIQTPKESFPLLLKIMKNHCPKIKEYSEEIQGFAKFYPEELHGKILSFLSLYPENYDVDIYIKKLGQIVQSELYLKEPLIRTQHLATYNIS